MIGDTPVVFRPRNACINVIFWVAVVSVVFPAGCGEKKDDSAGRPSGSAREASGDTQSRRDEAQQEVVEIREETDGDETGKDEAAKTGEDESGNGEDGGEQEKSGDGLGVLPGLSDEPTTVKIDEPWNSKNFDLVLTGPSELLKNEDSRVVLTLTPRKPYQVNKLFPFSLEISDVSDGLEVSARSFKKNDAAVFEDDRAVYHLNLKGTEEGKREIGGLFSFSVCTPKFCETPKARISVEVEVKRKPKRAAKKRVKKSG